MGTNEIQFFKKFSENLNPIKNNSFQKLLENSKKLKYIINECSITPQNQILENDSEKENFSLEVEKKILEAILDRNIDTENQQKLFENIENSMNPVQNKEILVMNDDQEEFSSEEFLVPEKGNMMDEKK